MKARSYVYSETLTKHGTYVHGMNRRPRVPWFSVVEGKGLFTLPVIALITTPGSVDFTYPPRSSYPQLRFVGWDHGDHPVKSTRTHFLLEAFLYLPSIPQ